MGGGPGNIKHKSYIRRTVGAAPSSGKDLDNSVTTTTDDPTTVAAPNDAAHPFASHQSMTGDFVGAASLLEVPKPEAGVMSSRN